MIVILVTSASSALSFVTGPSQWSPLRLCPDMANMDVFRGA